MSTTTPGQRDLGSPAGPPPELAGRLGYLLKHAQLGLAGLTAAALEPYRLTGRELAVLTVLAGDEPASQQQAAQRLGVDRTTDGRPGRRAGGQGHGGAAR